MKILAIIGSPKGKGNSYKVTKKLEEEMNLSNKAEFEYIFLKDFNIQMCKGCFSCVRNGEQYCPLKDDINILKEKMHQSDGIIFVSPCYCQNVTALMKNFIDRFSYLFHRPEFFKQKALALSTTGGSGLKDTLNYMSKLEIWGFGTLTQLGIICPPWPMRDGLKNKNRKHVKVAAEKFIEELQKEGKSSPNFTQYTHFRFLKKASEMNEYMPMDNEFYKDKEEYFYPVKVNFLYKIIVSVLLPVILYIMRDIGPKDD